VSPSEVLNTGAFSLERAQAAPGWLRELNAFEAEMHEARARPAAGGSSSSSSGGQGSGAGAASVERDGGAAASTSGHYDDHDHAHHHHHHHHKGEADEYGISSFVYYARRPFHPGRLLHDALSRQWGGVLRSKGFFWLATRHDVMGLWQSAGGAWQGEPRCGADGFGGKEGAARSGAGGIKVLVRARVGLGAA
jgi:G3E family GTPase